MAWIFIIIAGLFEILVVAGVRLMAMKKYFIGFIIYIVSFSISLFILYLGMKEINMSIAYAAYTGIGVVGTVISGILFWGESRKMIKFVYVIIIMICIFVLKITS